MPQFVERIGRMDFHAKGVRAEHLSEPPAMDQARNVIFLIGPGRKAWNVKKARKWMQSVAPREGSLYIVGDGERDVPREMLYDALWLAAKDERPTTFCALMHGMNVKDNPRVDDGSEYAGCFGRKNAATSEGLFNLITYFFTPFPVDVALFSCYSGAALSKSDILPKGSRVSVFSWPKETLSRLRIDATFETLAREKPAIIDAESLYEAFLAAEKGPGSMPALAVVGEGIEVPSRCAFDAERLAMTEKEMGAVDLGLEPESHDDSFWLDDLFFPEQVADQILLEHKTWMDLGLLQGDLIARKVTRPLVSHNIYLKYAELLGPSS